jgi:hypothetical protein
MKQIIYILPLITGLLSCNIPSKPADTTLKKARPSKHHTKQDTLLISTEIGDTLQYAKADFNRMVDQHPEFFEEYPDDPDQAYFNNTDKEEFGSQVGQDRYYIMYAYFLKQRNGVKEFAQQRQKLIDIYSHINALFERFEYGGTYFGHQVSRILGYAEYSIYLLPKTDDDTYKTYDITRQKELYIQSLRQLIKDESKIDLTTQGQEKTKRSKELNKLVDGLDKLITHNFYLRRAQEFQYRHYEYY